MSRELGRRQDLKVPDFPDRCESGFCNTCPSPQFLSPMEARCKSEVCSGDVAWNTNFFIVGKYDSKLLDPHSNIWIPAVSRWRRQRHEYWGVAARHGNL